MRIYSDQSLNVLVIEGVSQGPVADFQFSHEGELVYAFRIGSQLYDFSGVRYQTILDERGRTFGDIESTMSYLNALTIPAFPLRFTTDYPVRLQGDVVSIDEQFINNYIFLVDGGNA